MTASQAFCCGWLMLPHIRPARWNPAGGKFDQRCFWALLLQSNSTVFFSVSLNVARKAFAAATIFGVVSCDVLDVVDTPVVDVVAAVDVVPIVGVIAPAAAALVGVAPAAEDGVGVDAVAV